MKIKQKGWALVDEKTKKILRYDRRFMDLFNITTTKRLANNENVFAVGALVIPVIISYEIKGKS